MKQKTTQTLYGYWNEVRAGRLAPARLEIEPSRIGGVLAETFMLERATKTSFPFRLAGTRLCEMFGSELRGTNFLDGWGNIDRGILADHLASTCEQGAVTLLTLEAGEGARRVQIEAIVLPLMHAEGKIGRLLGAMSPIASPHWLGHETLDKKRLVSHELIWPDGRPHALISRLGRGAPFTQSSSERVHADKWRNFRVVEGGRAKR